MPVPFYLVTGFLGSGKTTLLKRFIAAFADDLRLGIVQNEFTALNVDSEELRLTGKPFHLLEVNRGSVFCVCLVADFKTSLSRFIDEYSPQAVFLEASGLADPIAIAELFSAQELAQRLYLARIWCVVDASTFLLLKKANLRITHQVRVADVVIINKTDLVDEKTIAEVEERVRRINPAADVVATVFCETGFDDVMNNQQLALCSKEILKETSLPRPQIGTAVVKTANKISRTDLEKFLSVQAPAAFRIKGFAQLSDGAAVMIQSTFGRTQILPAPGYSGVTELIAVGPEIQQQQFAQQFRDLSCL